MTYAVRLSTALPRPLAAVRHTVRASEIPSVIQAQLGEVWTFLRARSITSTGHNVAVYMGTGETGTGDTSPDPRLDALFGVEIHEVIAPAGGVIVAETPGGLVASTVHWGRYDRLREAHDAVQSWCRAGGRRMTATCWEVYGPWSDDWARVRTDVFYLLEP